MLRVVCRVVLKDVIKQIPLEVGIVLIERIGDLILVSETGCLDLLR